MSDQPEHPPQPQPQPQPPQPPQPPGGSQPSTPPGAGYGAPPPGAGYGAPPQQGYGMPPGGAGGQLSQSDERTWGMLAHISSILAAIVGLSFLGPLAVLLIQGNKSQFVRRQAIEALNFQITTYIAAIVSGLLILLVIGIVLLPLVLLAWLILTIVAGVAANNGQDYRYPLNIRLIK